MNYRFDDVRCGVYDLDTGKYICSYADAGIMRQSCLGTAIKKMGEREERLALTGAAGAAQTWLGEELIAHNAEIVKMLMREHNRFLKTWNSVGIILKNMHLEYDENGREQYAVPRGVMDYVIKIRAELGNPEKV